MRIRAEMLVALVASAALASAAVATPKRFGDRLEPRVSARAPTSTSTQPPPPRTEAHRQQLSTEQFAVPASASSTTSTLPAPSQPPSSTSAAPPALPRPASGLRAEPWALPLLALSSLVMIAVAGFEAFVLCSVRRAAPSRRHLFLGQMLLLGVFACAAEGALLSASPSAAACAVARFGAGASLALVFATLLVKGVFAASLEHGVRLPAAYQALLLFFAVLTQAAIGGQWLRAEGGGCRAPFSEVVGSLAYAGCLAVGAGGVALRARRRAREAAPIAWAAGSGALLALVGVGAALLTAPRHRDGCLGFGIALAAAAVFVVMFAPKGRELIALGRDDDRLSSLSRAASAYSPSFFHFKPVKFGAVGAAASPTPSSPQTKTPPPPLAYRHLPRLYCCPGVSPLHPLAPPYRLHWAPPLHFAPGLMRADDVNMYTTLEPTFSSNPNVFFQRNDGVHPGMMY